METFTPYSALLGGALIGLAARQAPPAVPAPGRWRAPLSLSPSSPSLASLERARHCRNATETTVAGHDRRQHQQVEEGRGHHAADEPYLYESS